MSLPISASAAGISSAGGNDLWSLVKARRQAQAERQEGLGYVEKQLSSVLLGVELGEAEQAEYVQRLSGTAAAAQEIREDLEVTDISLARVPRDLYLMKAGGISWRPFPITQRQVHVAPMHRRLQARMAKAIKQRRKLAPESVRSTVYSIGFRAVGGQDADRLDLSGWGLKMLSQSDGASLLLPEPPRVEIFPVIVDPQRSL